MFSKVFTFLALVAVAFASPSPKADPQVLAYSSPAVVPVSYNAYSTYSAYPSAPLAYAAAPAVAAPAAYPYAYYYR